MVLKSTFDGNIVDPSGKGQSYLPFGAELNPGIYKDTLTGDVGEHIGFINKPYNSASGLPYLGARYYDPLLGRFMGIDPIGFKQSLPISFNRYAYSNNNPTRYKDPDGKSAMTYGAVRGAGIGGELGAFAGPLGSAAGAIVGAGIGGYLGYKVGNAIHNQLAEPNEQTAKPKDSATQPKPKDVTKRPSGFRKKTKQDAWDNAQDGSEPGTKACPTCGKNVNVNPADKKPRDWDVDHQPPWKSRDLTGKTRKDVLDEYNQGTRLECPGCNRSRGAKPADEVENNSPTHESDNDGGGNGNGPNNSKET